ncbi:MAG TPA: amidase, partial [Myxococcota bacterium]
MALDLDTAAAVDLAAAVRAKDVSPTELVDEFIGRIERVNPRLNAMVATRFELARAEAAGMTQQLGSVDDTSTLPPLFGVPCTIKDCFGLEGLPHTAGSLRRRHTIARVDGTAPRRWREAGMIPLGLTNVPEMAFWYETDNLVYGRTNNPYDVTRTVAGSSGGEG